MLEPAAEREPRVVDERHQLRHRVRAVLRMQQRIGERRLLAEVGRLVQQPGERMCRRQRRERGNQVLDLVIGGTDADAAAELLQHVDAGASVRRVHHQVHRAVGLQHVTQRAQPRIGICEVVQHACAHDQVERRFQLTDTLDRQLMHLEVGQLVSAPEVLGAAHAGGAEVDADDACRRRASGMLGRLRRAAACNEDRALFGVRPVGPEHVKVGAPAVAVLPALPVVVERFDRRRIRVALVEVLDSASHALAPSVRPMPAADADCQSSRRGPRVTYRWCSPP